MADPRDEKKPQVRPDPVPEDVSEESIDRERADSGPASDPPSIGGTTAGAGCGRYPVPDRSMIRHGGFIMRHSARRLILAAVLGLLAACASSDGERLYPPKSFFVFFAVDSADLTPEAQLVIERIAEEARQTRATGVGVVGYASPVGSSAHNLRLSDMRAAAVEVALRSRGVPGDIIVRTHHGATPIIGPEIEGQRVEVVVSREERARR